VEVDAGVVQALAEAAHDLGRVGGVAGRGVDCVDDGAALGFPSCEGWVSGLRGCFVDLCRGSCRCHCRRWWRPVGSVYRPREVQCQGAVSRPRLEDVQPVGWVLVRGRMKVEEANNEVRGRGVDLAR
jgi:hypothetical protein